MKIINPIELEMLKNSMHGKGKDKILELLNFPNSEMVPMIYNLDSSLCNVSWDLVKDEIVNSYLDLRKNDELQYLEIMLQKKNAKLGFPVRDSRIYPKFLPIERKVNKNDDKILAKKVDKKKSHQNIKNLEHYQTPKTKFSGLTITQITNIIKLKIKVFKKVLYKYNIDKNENQILEEGELNLVLDYILKREKLILARASREKDLKHPIKLTKKAVKSADQISVYSKLIQFGAGKLILIGKKS